MSNLITNIRRASAPLQEQSSSIGMRVGKFISQSSMRLVEAAGGADPAVNDLAVAVVEEDAAAAAAAAAESGGRLRLNSSAGAASPRLDSRKDGDEQEGSTTTVAPGKLSGSLTEIAAEPEETSTATALDADLVSNRSAPSSDSAVTDTNTNTNRDAANSAAGLGPASSGTVHLSAPNSRHGSSVHGGGGSASAASSTHGASAHGPSVGSGGAVRGASSHGTETGALMRSTPCTPSPSPSVVSAFSASSPRAVVSGATGAGLPPPVPAGPSPSLGGRGGTTVLFFPGMAGEEDNKKLVVCKSRALPHLFTRLRDRKTPSQSFKFYAGRMMRILAEEGIACLESSRPFITTPTGATFSSVYVDESLVCIVSILRAGDALAEAAQSCIPHAPVGKVLIQRDEESEDKHPVLFYKKFPPKIGTMQVLLCDPMLATGGSAKMAIRALIEAGVKESNVVFVTVIVCPEGLASLSAEFPEVTVVTGVVDDCLDERRYIVPGLGDFGDRFFGTVS